MRGLLKCISCCRVFSYFSSTAFSIEKYDLLTSATSGDERGRRTCTTPPVNNTSYNQWVVGISPIITSRFCCALEFYETSLIFLQFSASNQLMDVTATRHFPFCYKRAVKKQVKMRKMHPNRDSITWQGRGLNQDLSALVAVVTATWTTRQVTGASY